MQTLPARNIILYTLLAGLSFLGTACGTKVPDTAASTPTLFLITAALPPTQTPHPSPTLQPATATPTITPVEGQTTSQLNVRNMPSASGDLLGTVDIFAKVQIVGKNADGGWWQIVYPESPMGVGWITEQFVQVTGTSDVPIIDEQAGPTPASSNNPPSTLSATVTGTVNVRSGPSATFDALGMLPAQTVVTLTGKTPDSAWLQIVYPSAPGGYGWVSAAFVQAQGVESLPIITEAGQTVGTETPSPGSQRPTPTVVAALEDGDSPQSPAVSITLSAADTRSFSYSSDLSSPTGDLEDWVQFQIAGQSGQPQTVSVTLSCSGNNTLNVELVQNNLRLDGWEALACGNPAQLVLSLYAGGAYTLRLLPTQGNDTLNYISYTMTVALR